MIIALTGYIAAGKTYVSAIFQEFGFKAISADVIYSELSEKGKPLYWSLVEIWGKAILSEDGDIDRKKLADLVMSSKENLDKLNSLTHPKIIREIESRIKSFSDCDIILEAPLLEGSGLESQADLICLVDADVEVRKNRLKRRGCFSDEEAMTRIKAQKKISSSLYDEVILNNGSYDDLRSQILRILNKHGRNL